MPTCRAQGARPTAGWEWPEQRPALRDILGAGTAGTATVRPAWALASAAPLASAPPRRRSRPCRRKHGHLPRQSLRRPRRRRRRGGAVDDGEAGTAGTAGWREAHGSRSRGGCRNGGRSRGHFSLLGVQTWAALARPMPEKPPPRESRRRQQSGGLLTLFIRNVHPLFCVKGRCGLIGAVNSPRLQWKAGRARWGRRRPALQWKAAG